MPYTTFCEDEIKSRFVKAYNILTYERENLLVDCRLFQETVSDCTKIDEKLNALYSEIEVVAELTRRCVDEKSQSALNQEEYLKRYNDFVERYENLKKDITSLEAKK